MQIKTKGLILKQRNIGETDRIFTILSEDFGVIEATARNIKTAKSSLAGSAQILSYNEFCFFKGKSNYIINSCDVIEAFFSLRLDICKLSLAGYFCELIDFMCKTGDENAKVYLKLILNVLYFLQKSDKSDELLKSIFELRSMEISGFMPNLVGCENCAQYETEKMFFLPLEGTLMCAECYETSPRNTPNTIKFTLPKAVLSAMRFIIFSEMEKLFSFNLSGNSLQQLNFITENYIFLHTDAKFNSLEMYKALKE